MTSDVDHASDLAARPGRTIEFTVDGDTVTTDQPVLTPNAILQLAGIASETHYLVKIEGRHQESFQGRGDESIRVHPHERFVSVSTGPTPVS